MVVSELAVIHPELRNPASFPLKFSMTASAIMRSLRMSKQNGLIARSNVDFRKGDGAAFIFCDRLLVAQCADRIHTSCPARGQPSGKQRDREKKRSDNQECERIARC